MKQINKNLQAMLLVCLLWLSGSAVCAQTTVSGTVSDENGEPLIGATVKVANSTKGTVTDIEGNFSISVAESSFDLEVSSVGYGTQTIAISGATSSLNITMSEDAILGEEVVVSASRQAEKIQDAPASISVVDAKTIASQPANNPTLMIQNENGVQIDRQGSNRINISMRGQAGLFGTSAFVMLDYRSLVGAGINTFAGSQAAMNNLDIESVEVVRGPGSALYGPGVTTGVVHFISKDPFRHPGAAVEVAYGELNTFKMAGRYAWHNDAGTFGFKVVAQYQRADEWLLDEGNSEDATTLAIINANREVIDPRTDEVVRTHAPGLQDYNENWGVAAGLEFRPNSEMKINFNTGLTRNDGMFWQTLGEGRDNNWDYFAQARLSWKGLFAQVFYSGNQTPDDLGQRNFIWRADALSIINREQIEAQVQYTFDIDAINTQMTVGAETRNSFSDTETIVYGRNEDDDDFLIQGAYFQSKTALLDKLDLVLAARFDNYSHSELTSFAPRAGLVYKINPKHSIRFTYNKAYAPNSALENNIDFVLARAGTTSIWLGGNKNGNPFDGSHQILAGGAIVDRDIVLSDLYLPYLVGAFSNPDFQAALAAQGLDAATQANILTIAQTFNAPSDAISTVGFTGTDAAVRLDPTDVPQTALREEDTFEIGYKGVIANKLAVSLDVYNIRRQNFVSVQPVTPFLQAPSLDDQFAALAPELVALFTPSVGPLAANAATAVIGALQATNAATGGFVGIARTEGLPVPGQDIPNANLAPGGLIIGWGYPQFGDVNYFGADLGLKYFIRSDLNIFYNHSWLGQTVFTATDQGEATNSVPDYNLNMPANRIRAGIAYEPEMGLFANAQYQFQEQFTSNIGGAFNGPVAERHLVNAAVGYNFDFGLTLIASGQNVFDQQYRTYANMPLIGRRTTVTARYTF